MHEGVIPQEIILKTKQDSDIVPLLKWFKNEFMKWTPQDPVCEICINISDSPSDVSDSGSSSRMSEEAAAAVPIMQLKK